MVDKVRFALEVERLYGEALPNVLPAAIPKGVLIGCAQSGKVSVNRNGYKVVSVAGRTVLEYRLVMEGVLGRPLLMHENVHHKNGDRLDNNPDNLELWSHSHPIGQRVDDLLSWARMILTLYGEEA